MFQGCRFLTRIPTGRRDRLRVSLDAPAGRSGAGPDQLELIGCLPRPTNPGGWLRQGLVQRSDRLLWLEREAAETGGPLRRGGDAPGADSLAEISGQRPPELSGDLPLRTVRVNPLAAVVPNGYRPLTAFPPRSIVNSPDLNCRSNVDERLFGLDHSSIPRQ